MIDFSPPVFDLVTRYVENICQISAPINWLCTNFCFIRKPILLFAFLEQADWNGDCDWGTHY